MRKKPVQPFRLEAVSWKREVPGAVTFWNPQDLFKVTQNKIPSKTIICLDRFMGLTLDTCNMNLKQCCANRILFLCIKHQLLGHISSSGITSWKILHESQESESSTHQVTYRVKALNPQLKTPNQSPKSKNGVKIL